MNDYVNIAINDTLDELENTDMREDRYFALLGLILEVQRAEEEEQRKRENGKNL